MQQIFRNIKNPVNSYVSVVIMLLVLISCNGRNNSLNESKTDIETNYNHMKSVEIDFVVSDVMEAIKVYEAIFEVERVDVTDQPKGLNEVIFKIYGVPFHMLDENPDYQLIAPKPDDPKSIWFNIIVPDIAETYAKAMATGCTEIQPITEVPEMKVSNAMFIDPFGHIWMLHQVYTTD